MAGGDSSGIGGSGLRKVLLTEREYFWLKCMRKALAECIVEERDRCADLCDARSNSLMRGSNSESGMMAQAARIRAGEAQHLAEAIRNRTPWSPPALETDEKG